MKWCTSLFVAMALITPTASQAKEGPKAATQSRANKQNPKVAFDTNKGRFVVRLFADKAPVSAQNFLRYVKENYYAGTIFHRVIPDFMVQGGGFDTTLKQKRTHDSIRNEADNGLSNLRGTVAMARTNEVNSATSQFFINVKDNKQLDHSDGNFGYAVIGEVIDGMDVVDAIRQVPTRCPSFTGQPCLENLPGGMRDVPKDAVVIHKATVLGR